MEAPLDYGEKREVWQWRFGYEFAPMKLRRYCSNEEEDKRRRNTALLRTPGAVVEPFFRALGNLSALQKAYQFALIVYDCQ